MQNIIRLAIYYTPAPDSDLAQTAAAWLGRDNTIGSFLGQPKLSLIAEDRLREITTTPFHYGFHATIKPPFQLVPDVTIEHVEERLEDFAAQYEKFILPPLELQYMHDFFCLRLSGLCPQLHILPVRPLRVLTNSD